MYMSPGIFAVSSPPSSSGNDVARVNTATFARLWGGWEGVEGNPMNATSARCSRVCMRLRLFVFALELGKVTTTTQMTTH